MTANWEKTLACSIRCERCDNGLSAGDKRILSVYDHAPICLECKGKEEKRPDYEAVSRNMIGSLMAESEVIYSDPGGYCYYHFYPFDCKK